ncbi:GDYXXLXY domain-containing protein [Pontiellaceae bacterium B12219]|nr:GDYXXLXY domain-containing protein [Pontiellaceae bacterium B12219]
MKKLFLTLLLVLISIQLYVPFQLIRSKERILKKGQEFRFLTRPIDPADPFQGRYVRLQFRNDFITQGTNSVHSLKRGTQIYAHLKEDEQGFACFYDWSNKPPADRAYLKTRYERNRRSFRIQDGVTNRISEIQIDLPFDRFYMDEAKAPRAERLAATAARTTNCWAAVRIYEGNAAIEEVYAEGKPLSELAAEKR